jgi:hypothetical protein
MSYLETDGANCSRFMQSQENTHATIEGISIKKVELQSVHFSKRAYKFGKRMISDLMSEIDEKLSGLLARGAYNR